MENVFKILALAGGALLAVAVLVACWEQWRHGARKNYVSQVPTRALSIDVNIDSRAAELATELAAQIPAAAPLPDRRRQRTAALDSALEGMVRGPAVPAFANSKTWVETQPMVNTGSKDKAAAS